MSLLVFDWFVLSNRRSITFDILVDASIYVPDAEVAVVFLCLLAFTVSAGYFLKKYLFPKNYLANPDNYMTRGCSPIHVEGKGLVCGDQSMEDWMRMPGQAGSGLGNTV